MTHYRDTVMLFKYMMTPLQENLPEIKAWMPNDARLYWKVHQRPKHPNLSELERPPVLRLNKTWSRTTVR